MVISASPSRSKVRSAYGEGHVAVAVVMAVGLTVGGEVDELGSSGRSARSRARRRAKCSLAEEVARRRGREIGPS